MCGVRAANMQIPLRTQSNVESYIAKHEWLAVRLDCCPLHPSGGCSFARHGTYERATPPGMRIARWYCPEGHRTFSLLPDFLAARLPGLLGSVDAVVASVPRMRSMEAAANSLRQDDVSLPAAVRWLRRRVRAVQAALQAVSSLHPPTLGMWHLLGMPGDASSSRTLVELRRELCPQTLSELPAPLGFLRLQRGVSDRGASDQQDTGPDGGREPIYAAAVNCEQTVCSSNHPIHADLGRLRRQPRSSMYGVTTDP
jgi:hypothetical protein